MISPPDSLPPSPPHPSSNSPLQQSVPRPSPIPTIPPLPTRRANRRISALACLILVAGCVTAADLLLKFGTRAIPPSSPTGGENPLQLLTQGTAALADPYTVAGILFHICGLAAWLYTLRKIPLVLAYSFTAVQQATIALGAWLWLGERISPLRWAGIATVMLGVLILVPTIISAEQRTASPAAKGNS